MNLFHRSVKKDGKKTVRFDIRYSRFDGELLLLPKYR